MRHPKLSQVPALQNLGGGAAVIWSASGLPELWIAPEREHGGFGQKGAFPSMRHPKLSQVPALQTWVAGRFFGVLPACRSFGLRRSGNTADRPEGRVPEHASSKAVTSASTPKLGWRSGDLECFRLAGALDCAGAGTRRIGQKGVLPSIRHPKLSQVPALQTWVAGRLFGVPPACRWRVR